MRSFSVDCGSSAGVVVSTLNTQTEWSRRVIQEVVRGVKTGTNTLEFEVSGSGALQLSDIILWFQGNID